MATYTIKENSSETRGEKLTMTVTFSSGEETEERYIELEPFEYLGENEEMQLEVSEEMIASSLQRFADFWESNLK